MILRTRAASNCSVQRTVRSCLIVIDSSGFDAMSCIGQRFELIAIQTFVPKASVEQLNIAVFRGLSRTDEVESYAVLLGSTADEHACG